MDGLLEKITAGKCTSVLVLRFDQTAVYLTVCYTNWFHAFTEWDSESRFIVVMLIRFLKKDTDHVQDLNTQVGFTRTGIELMLQSWFESYCHFLDYKELLKEETFLTQKKEFMLTYCPGFQTFAACLLLAFVFPSESNHMERIFAQYIELFLWKKKDDYFLDKIPNLLDKCIHT